MNKCLNCGKPAKNKYCSIKCCNQHQSAEKIKNLSSKKVREKAIKTRKSKWKTFIVTCANCKKDIEIKEFNVDKPKKEKYYCSRGCANVRHHNLETRDKIRKSLIRETEIKWKEPHIKICKECEKEFKTIYKNKDYCSVGCKRKNNKTYQSSFAKEKIQLSVLKQYKNGKKVYGGTTKWYDYKQIRVQGTYELRTCQILDTWKQYNVIKDWEYTNDRVQYIDSDGKNRTYLLDFKVFTNEGFSYYIEVKGYEKPNDILKWKAVRETGNKLEVWFEKDIIKLETNGAVSVSG